MQNDSGASLAETIYRKMSDEELQNTLRCETFSDGALDVKQIEMILAEMERRGINEPIRSKRGMNLSRSIPGRYPTMPIVPLMRRLVLQ